MNACAVYRENNWLEICRGMHAISFLYDRDRLLASTRFIKLGGFFQFFSSLNVSARRIHAVPSLSDVLKKFKKLIRSWSRVITPFWHTKNVETGGIETEPVSNQNYIEVWPKHTRHITKIRSHVHQRKRGFEEGRGWGVEQESTSEPLLLDWMSAPHYHLYLQVHVFQPCNWPT